MSDPYINSTKRVGLGLINGSLDVNFNKNPKKYI